MRKIPPEAASMGTATRPVGLRVCARRWLVVPVLAALIGAAVERGTDRGRITVERGAAAQAIQHGLAYLRSNPHDVSALIVLDYLQRAYELPADLAFETTRTGAGDEPRLLMWGRFVGDDRLTDAAALGALTADAGIEEMVMHALYCDRFLLPATYGELLQRFAKRGDYELTHAALAVKLIRDHGCSLQGIDLAAFEDKLRQRSVELVKREAGDARFEERDVRYEALAILQDFLEHRTISSSEIAGLLAEQQADGGWRPQADQPSAPHPTVMAVWALLAWTHTEVRGCRFARR
jgi:hypothetical protein